MTKIKVTRADQVPANLQRGAKAALAVGANVAINSDRDSLLVQFKDADQYYFDPEHVTLHCLELLGAARTFGFVAYRDFHEGRALATRHPFIVRVVFSAGDVRVQIGASRWYAVENGDTAVAMRRALVDAFCDYYDEAIAPYPEA